MINKVPIQTNVEIEIQKDIYKLINELKKMSSTNRAARLIGTLDVIEEIINDNNLNVSFPKEYTYELNKFKMNQYDREMNNFYYYLNIAPMENYNKKLCKISEYFKKKYKLINQYVLFHKIDIKDTIKITEDFLKQYDEEIYDLFEKMLKNNRIFLGNSSSNGVTITGNYLMDPYIIIAPGNTIDDSITLIHEIFHAHISKKIETMNDSEDTLNMVNNYFEVYSIFSELLSCDYLEKIKYTSDTKMYSGLILKSLCDSLDNFKKNEYNDIDSERYSYGYVLAYHFYNQYKKDPEQAKKNIMSFMMDSKDHFKMELLNSNGLNSKEILNPQKIEKNVKNLERQPK